MRFLATLLASILFITPIRAVAQSITSVSAPGVVATNYSSSNFTNTGSSLTAAGYGLTGWAGTPSTNLVIATARGVLQNAGTANNVTLQLRCGTGTAPSQGAASTGTLVGTAVPLNGNAVFTSYNTPWSAQGTFVTTAGTAIWCDMFDSTSTASNIIIISPGVTIQGTY